MPLFDTFAWDIDHAPREHPGQPGHSLCVPGQQPRRRTMGLARPVETLPRTLPRERARSVGAHR
jgi:hypothetical protein